MSKSFTDYLTENKKTYPFKIGFAGELPEGFEDRLEAGLSKYGVTNLAPGKKTPIQERPLDFPQLQNTEVTYYEAELTYPTTSAVLKEYLGHLCSIAASNIIVRNPNEPEELYQATKEDTPYEVKLTQEDLGGESAQDSVGENRVMSLLKDLEAARKETSKS